MLKLSEAEVHLYRLNLDADASVAASDGDQLLSQVERERADKFVFPIHRERYVRGRSWLRKTVAAYTGMSAEELVLAEREHGKPYVEESSIEFNLSHAENQAVLAVAQQPVGVDLESFSRLVESDELSKIHFTKSERKWFNQFSGTKHQQAFFWLWTAKEARMKITGEGFALPSTDIEVAFEGNLPDRYVLPEQPVVHLKALAEVFPEAACCVATMEPVKQLDVKN